MHRINQAMRRVKRSGGITDHLHAPAALSMGKKAARTHWREEWVDLRTGLNTERKIPVTARIQTTNLQPCSF